MEEEFWIQASDGTSPPVLYTKNTAIAVIKRVQNQHPYEAVEPMISKTFRNVQVLHEARNTLFRKATSHRGAMRDDHGNVPATRRCHKLAIKDIMMILEDNTDKLIVTPVVEWMDVDYVHNLCKGSGIPIEEETRVGGPLSFKVQEMEKNVMAIMKNMDSFRKETERRWDLEEASRRNGAGVGAGVGGGAGGGGTVPVVAGAVAAGAGAAGTMSFSSVAGGSQARPAGQGRRSGHPGIPGLHVNGAPVGAQLLVETQEVQEVGGWEEVAARRRPRGRSPQVKRGAEALEKPDEVKARTRPAAKFGTRVVNMEGAEAAPVSFFIGNTNPKSVKESIEKVVLQCANELGENKLKVEDIEVISLTKVEHPRTKCWKLTVPNRWRETFRDDSFWPMGWSHRPWSNRNLNNVKDSAKKQRTKSQSEEQTTPASQAQAPLSQQAPLAGQVPLTLQAQAAGPPALAPAADPPVLDIDIDMASAQQGSNQLLM